MEKVKLEKLLDADTISLYLDEIYGKSARKTVEYCKELRKVLAEAVDHIAMIEDNKSELARMEEENEELRTQMLEMADAIRTMKAELDAQKAGNDTPIGLV